MKNNYLISMVANDCGHTFLSSPIKQNEAWYNNNVNSRIYYRGEHVAEDGDATEELLLVNVPEFATGKELEKYISVFLENIEVECLGGDTYYQIYYSSISEEEAIEYLNSIKEQVDMTDFDCQDEEDEQFQVCLKLVKTLYIDAGLEFLLADVLKEQYNENKHLFE